MRFCNSLRRGVVENQKLAALELALLEASRQITDPAVAKVKGGPSVASATG